MSVILKRIEISGYKSIAHVEIELGRLNVLIGANGAGKSNMLQSLGLFHALAHGTRDRYVSRTGGASAILHGGPKRTNKVTVTLVFESPTEIFEITRNAEFGPPDRLNNGEHKWTRKARTPDEILKGATPNAGAPSNGTTSTEDIGASIEKVTDDFKVYRFMDTTDTAAIRQSCYLHDNKSIRADGGNLAAVLYRIFRRNPICYSRIIKTVCQIAPWFGDFVLEPLVDDLKRVQLDWRHADSEEPIYGPHQLPDGALRAMALITLLLQPKEDLPSLIVIDEPELGLHPAAIAVVAGLMKAASLHSQIIVATQSVTFLEEFDAADVIVVDREDGRSTFTRQDPERLKDWLAEYTIGELWQKNTIGGGPF
jgi:predicted ATPase